MNKSHYSRLVCEMVLDPYAILELPWGASAADIKHAFRQLSHRYHPDRNQGSAVSEERLKLLTAAYHRLKEANWSLPRPAPRPSKRSVRPVERVVERQPPVWPEFWPDGSPIHYPSAEELESLLRDADSIAIHQRLRHYGAWVERALAHVVVYFLVAMLAAFLLTMAVRFVIDLW